jgi:hypothetical protein
MKHAGPAALDRLEPFLKDLRRRSALKEKSRGIFYRGGRAFLHFHEYGEEFFADLRRAAEFERFPATSPKDRAALLKLVDKAVKD